ncbi:riboflavin synthase domain-like protein [Saitoella complicata NRRL Y-17804]|nr:riboflavin synthase domain-like protein [Saitoella complicata NRRL Y-17804]ODQ49941.1 riboflavin synthase domain-like protein [Saitoella complicata NRRL Y-17804]
MVERGEGDESHPQGIDAGLRLWLKDLRQVMEAEMPLPLGLTPIPNDCLLSHTYAISFGKHALGDKTAAPIRSGVTFSATVTKNDRISADDHWQDVRRVVLSIPSPDLTHDPGDIAVLRPENPHRHSTQHPSETEGRQQPAFTDTMHAQNVGNQEDLWDYTTRPRRNILEVLADVKETLSIPIDYVLDLFPVLKPRQYSLASSLKMHPGEAQILAAIVDYKTSMHTPRVGIASRWLRSLKPGTQLTTGLIRGAMIPPPPGAKCVMVAPGTGIAPMRALIQDRIASGSDATEQLLVFGNRQREKDFLLHSG